MSGTTNLKITITADVTNAKQAVEALRKQLGTLAGAFGQKTSTSASGDPLAQIAKLQGQALQMAKDFKLKINLLHAEGLDANAKLDRKAAAEATLVAKEKADQLVGIEQAAADRIARVRKTYASTAQGLPKWQINQAAYLKSADKDIGFQRQITGSTGTGGINWLVNRPQASMSEATRVGIIQQMKLRQEMEIDIRKAHLVKLNGILEMEDDIHKANLVKVKARALMEKDIQKAGLVQIKAGEIDVERDRLKSLGQKMFSATGDKGFLLHGGMSHADLQSYTKEINAFGKALGTLEHQQRMLKAQGITDPKILRDTVAQRYSQRQEKSWGAGGSLKPDDHIVMSDKNIKMLEKYGALSKDMMHQLTPFRGFVQDVVGFMHMQVRWFASAAILFAIPTAIRAVTKAFLEFDKAVQDIAAVTDTTNEDLDLLRKRIIGVSLATPYSATEIAGLAKMLVQAGLSAAQTMNVLEGVAQTATISGATLEQTGKAFSTAIFAWKMASEESANIGKIIAGTLNESRLNIDDLATAYNYMASTSANFNISFAEANSILAVFSNLGLRASTMATGFSQVLSRLVKPTQEFTAAIEKNGKKYEDFVKILESKEPAKFAKMLKFLKEAGVSGVTALRTLGAREGRELSAAINAGPAAFDDMFRRINDSKELAERFAKAMGSISNQLALFKNRLVATSIQIGTMFKPLIEIAISALGVFGSMAFHVANGLQQLGSWSVWAAVMLSGIAVAVAKVITHWKELTGVVAASRLIFVNHPIMLVLTALAAGVALFSYFRGGSKDLNNFKKSVDDSIKGAKGLADQQKEGNKVWEESSRLIEDYTKRVEELNDIARFGGMRLPALAYEDYSVRADNAQAFALRAIGPIDSDLYDIEIKIRDLGGAAEYSTGLIYDLFSAFMPTGTTAIEQVISLTDKLLSKQHEMLTVKGMLATAAQKESEANAKSYTPKLKKDTDIAIGALREAAKKRVPYQVQMDNIYKAVSEEIAKDFRERGKSGMLDAFIGYAKSGDSGVADKAYLGEVRKVADDTVAIKEKMERAWDTIKQLLDSTKKLDPIAQIERTKEENLRKLEEELALLKGREGEFEERNKMTPEDARKKFVDAAELAKANVYTEANIKALEIKKGIEEDLIDRETRLLDLAKQLGAVSSFEATAKAEALKTRSIENQIAFKREELRLEEERAGLSSDPEGQNRVDKLRAELLKLDRERATEAEKTLKAYKAQGEELSKMQARMDLGESMGLDNTTQKRFLDFMQKAREIPLTGIDEEAGRVIATVWERMAKVGNGAQSIKEDFKGLWDSFGLGLGEATRGMDDLVNLSADFAKNIVSGFRGGIESFVSGITSKSEMKNWAKTKEAELAQTYTKTVDTNKQNTDYEIERLTRLKAITADIQEQAAIEQQIIALKTKRGSIEADAARRYDEETEKLKGNAGWMEFLKDKADTLFQSIVESFTKSVASMYADLITGGLFKWLQKLTATKEMSNASDATAIGQTIALNALLMTQSGIVAELTAAYWALAAAKILAGMGGASADLYGPSGAAYINSMSPRHHAGGLVMHGGGIVPRRGLGFDEIAATLQSGEMVINKRDTAKNMNLLNRINRGEDVKGARTSSVAPVINNYNTTNNIQTMDSQSFRDYALKNQGVFSEMYVRDMRMAGSTRTAGRSYR